MTFLRNRALALARLRIYLPVFLVGIAIQGLWMHRESVPASAGIAATEWPCRFPAIVSVATEGEKLQPSRAGISHAARCCRAGPPERPCRIRYAESDTHAKAALARTALDFNLYCSATPFGCLGLVRCHPAHGRRSAGVVFRRIRIHLLTLALGLATEVFPAHSTARLLVPMVWGKAFVLMAKNNPRAVGIAWLPIAIALTIGAGLSLHGPPIGSQSRYLEFQDEFSFLIWLLSAVLATWMIWANTAWLEPAARVSLFFRTSSGAPRINPRRIAARLGIGFVICLIFLGLKKQVDVARINLDSNSGINHSADAEAGAWIRSHTDTDTVVMARHVPTVYHHSQRKVIWFPPSSNPQLLMKGIVEHKTNFVIVVRRESSYFLPPDDISFAALLATYPGFFHLLYKASEFRIFEVTTDTLSRSQHILGAPTLAFIANRAASRPDLPGKATDRWSSSAVSTASSMKFAAK